MANEQQKLSVRMRPNVDAKSANYGKYFAEVGNGQTLSQRGFIEHLIKHGLAYPRSIIEGVMAQIVNCLPELLAAGTGVKLDGLGTFYPTIENVRGGVTYAELKAGGVDPNTVVQGIHVRFQPEGDKLDRITSRAFKEQVTLSLDTVIVAQKVGEADKAPRADATYDYEKWKALPADKDHGMQILPVNP